MSVFKVEDQETSEETTGNIDDKLGEISISEGEIIGSLTKNTEQVSEASEKMAESVDPN